MCVLGSLRDFTHSISGNKVEAIFREERTDIVEEYWVFSSIVRVYKLYIHPTLRIADAVLDCPGKGGTAALEEATEKQWEGRRRSKKSEGAQAQRGQKRLIAG